jgi:hypothetical protein
MKAADSQFTRVLAALGCSLELAVVNPETLYAMPCANGYGASAGDNERRLLMHMTALRRIIFGQQRMIVATSEPKPD